MTDDLEKYEVLVKRSYPTIREFRDAITELVAMVRQERERLENFKASRPWIERQQNSIMRDMHIKMRDWEYLAKEQMELRRKAERELAELKRRVHVNKGDEE